MDNDLKQKLLEQLKVDKVDFANLTLTITDCVNLSFNFKITPKDFLRFAKQDLQTGDNRGYINAITNAKRAIDCQTDRVLMLFNIKTENIPQAAIDFLKLENSKKSDSRTALLLIQALGIAPIDLIARARVLRHRLEHYYEVPSAQETKEAIEIAELFVNATEHRVFTTYDFYFGNHFNGGDMFNYTDISYAEKEHCFEWKTSEDEITKISIDSVVYYYLLKLSILAEEIPELADIFRRLLTYLEHPMPKQHVDVK